jgi:hypothetical protein
MMNDIEIDDLFRVFHAHIREPGLQETRVVARTSTGEARMTTRTGLSRHRRLPLGAIVSGLAVCGLAAALGLLALQSPDRPTQVAGVPTQPRVDWGITALVSVDPEPGAARDVSTERVRAALVARAQQRDMAGVTVEVVGDNLLSVTIPAATRDGAIREFIHSGSLAIYDLKTSFVTRWNTREEAQTGAKRLPGEIAGRFAVPNEGTIGIDDFVTTSQEADQLLAVLNAPGLKVPFERQWSLIPFPVGFRLIGQRDVPEGLSVIRDEPIVTGDAITRVEVTGSRVRMVLSDAAEASFKAALQGGAASTDLNVVVGVDGPIGDIAGPVTQAPNGDLVLDFAEQWRADALLATLGEPYAGVRNVDIQSTEPYGTQPAVIGEHVTPLPAWVEAARNNTSEPHTANPNLVDIAPDQVVHVLSAPSPGGPIDLYAARTPAGDDVYWSEKFGSNGCSIAIGAPRLQNCGNLGVSPGNPGFWVGRVSSPDITSVEVRRADGTVQPGTVGNGWYVIPSGANTAAGAAIVGLDKAGNELGRIAENGALAFPGQASSQP